MPLEIDKIPFGMSDIIVGTGADAVKFDGVDELQAEGGEISISPSLEDIVIEDYGTGPYDKRIVGYEGSVTIVAAQESIKTLKLALAASSEITETAGATVVGLADSPIGTSLRKKGKRVTIHPRSLPASDKSRDITIYMMISDGEFSRTSGNSQGNVTITLSMLPRDKMNPSGIGNFYYVGPVDPNPVV